MKRPIGRPRKEPAGFRRPRESDPYWRRRTCIGCSAEIRWRGEPWNVGRELYRCATCTRDALGRR